MIKIILQSDYEKNIYVKLHIDNFPTGVVILPPTNSSQSDTLLLNSTNSYRTPLKILSHLC